MRLLIALGMAVAAMIAAKRKAERKRTYVSDRMVETTVVDWKDVDVKKE